ncbi:MAG: molybdopterin converting factor subunit 1 [Burkholderiales bacterium]|jgi:molybdopterin synthase sulfur carrier subunit|nr:molybdopterin converting factor subunit 1 [Burkholderiales bacterium]
MKVTVRYFASIREAIGHASEVLETDATSVAALRDVLIARGTQYQDALSTERAVRMALNQSVCEASAPLLDNCEVAFFPPVTGG